MIQVSALLTVRPGESPIRPETDIHAVCDLAKSWFRVLPEPVFPPSSYYEIMQKMRKSLRFCRPFAFLIGVDNRARKSGGSTWSH